MFIDANVFIAAAVGNGPKALKCQDFLDKVERGEQNATTSVLVFDEVLYVLEDRMGSKEAACARVRRFLALPNLKTFEVNSKQLAHSLKLYAAYPLEPRDALHVAVALGNSVEKILSYDRDFDSVKEIRRVEP